MGRRGHKVVKNPKKFKKIGKIFEKVLDNGQWWMYNSAI